MIKIIKRILLLCLAIVTVFGFIGCSSSGPDPQNTVSSYLNDFKKGNFENTAKYVVTESDLDAREFLPEEDDEVSKAFLAAFNKIEYKILNSEVNGDKAVVETEIISPDLATIMVELISEALPVALASAFDEDSDGGDVDAIMTTMLTDKVNSDNMPIINKTIKINLIKENDQWLIQPDNDLINVLTGNLLEIPELFE